MSFEPDDSESSDNSHGEELRDDEVFVVAEPELLDTDSATYESASLEQPPSPYRTPIPVAESVELETSYLHPSSLVFTVINQLRQNLIPAALALFGAAKGNYVFVAIAAALFVLSIAAATVRYLTLRYSIQNGELTVQSGLIFRRLRKVPTSRIQNIDLVQNVLHRLFGVAEVRVETASGTEPEATLRVLSLAQVENLRSKVQSAASANQSQQTAPFFEGEQPHVSQATNINEVLRIPISWLIKAGLASNRGMVMIGFALGLYYQNLGEDGRDFRNLRDQLRGISSFLPDFGEGWQMWLVYAFATIAVLFLIRLLGIGWFILRFFGYRLSQQGNDFKISCGLFTKVSATVPVRRIQFISIHRSLFMRWLGLASIRIETAGGAGNNNENATTSVSKRWFIPVIPETQIANLMIIIRPDLEWTEQSFDWQPLAHRAASRFARIAVVMSIFLMVVGVGVSRPWGWIPGLALSPLLVWYSIKRSRSTKYTRIGDGVIFRSGVFTRKTSITFFEKVQGASISQSPFDRRWGMRTLTVDTAAAGPANHVISVRFLDAAFAESEYHEILRLSSRQASAV